jgi:hypothetical protein
MSTPLESDSMRAVRGPEGRRLVLESDGGDAARVYDPATGDRDSIPHDALEPIEDAPLAVVAERVDDPLRALVTAIPDERALGLLVFVADNGPTPVRTLLDRTTYCESDLHGLLVHLTAAGLLDERRADDGRTYTITDTASMALDRLD